MADLNTPLIDPERHAVSDEEMAEIVQTFHKDYEMTPTLHVDKKPFNTDVQEIDNSVHTDPMIQFHDKDCPEHYHSYDIQVIDMMEQIWGIDAVISFCKLSAFKYRMRMGIKTGMDMLRHDMQKEQWYLSKAKELEKRKEDNNAEHL